MVVQYVNQNVIFPDTCRANCYKQEKYKAGGKQYIFLNNQDNACFCSFHDNLVVMWIVCHRNAQYTYIVSFERVNFVFTLFLLIYLYWCTTRFQYQMMFLLYYRKTKTVTSITDISYSPPPGAPEFTPCSLYSSYCSIFCFLCSVLYITVCPFVSFPLAMILCVFCQFFFGHVIVCLFQLPFDHYVVCRLKCTASGYLFDIFKHFLHSY